MQPCIHHKAHTTHGRFQLSRPAYFCELRQPGRQRCMPRLHTVDRTVEYRSLAAPFLRFESSIVRDCMFPCERASKSIHTIRNRYNDPDEIQESCPFGDPRTMKPLFYEPLHIAHQIPSDRGKCTSRYRDIPAVSCPSTTCPYLASSSATSPRPNSSNLLRFGFPVCRSHPRST